MRLIHTAYDFFRNEVTLEDEDALEIQKLSAIQLLAVLKFAESYASNRQQSAPGKMRRSAKRVSLFAAEHL